MLKLLETVKDSAESTFDSAAARVENVHRLIGGYIGTQLRRFRHGAVGPPTADPQATRRARDEASIYDVIRGVNREIGEFGTDVFEIIDDARARRAIEKRAPGDDNDR